MEAVAAVGGCWLAGSGSPHPNTPSERAVRTTSYTVVVVVGRGNFISGSCRCGVRACAFG